MWGNQDSGPAYGGDQGGGYLNSPGFGSPQGGGEKKNRQRAQHIMPCTVAQIHSATHTDDRFLIDNIELHQVTVVGLVKTVKESSTRIDYELDDMTGKSLEVRQFLDQDENTPDEERIVAMRENMYVRAHGHVRAFQDKRSITAFKVLAVEDPNEITSHMLEVIQAHVALTRGTSMSGPAQATYGGATGTTADTTGGYLGARPDQGLTTVQDQVLNNIGKSMDEQGVSINFLSERMRGVPQHAIREAVEFLSSEGHIYSTIDDEHFKSTESM